MITVWGMLGNFLGLLDVLLERQDDETRHLSADDEIRLGGQFEDHHDEWHALFLQCISTSTFLYL